MKEPYKPNGRLSMVWRFPRWRKTCCQQKLLQIWYQTSGGYGLSLRLIVYQWLHKLSHDNHFWNLPHMNNMPQRWIMIMVEYMLSGYCWWAPLFTSTHQLCCSSHTEWARHRWHMLTVWAQSCLGHWVSHLLSFSLSCFYFTLFWWVLC